MPYELVSAILILVTMAAGVVLIRRRTQSQLASTLARIDAVNARPLAEVMDRVDCLLKRYSGRWDVTPARGAVSDFDAATNAFFSKYISVYDDLGFVAIDHDSVRPWKQEGFLRIDNSSEKEVTLLDPCTGQVVCLDTCEEPINGLKFASVYHLVLYQSEVSQEE